MAALAAATSAERHGFRTWLAGELGARRMLPDVFDRYEVIPLDKLIQGLRARRRDYERDPSTRAFRERLDTELATSRARLEQPLDESRRLDERIDAHVYDLYEVTDAQRALVDGEYEPTGASE